MGNNENSDCCFYYFVSALLELMLLSGWRCVAMNIYSPMTSTPGVRPSRTVTCTEDTWPRSTESSRTLVSTSGPSTTSTRRGREVEYSGTLLMTESESLFLDSLMARSMFPGLQDG